MVRDPPAARDKPTAPQPSGKGQDGRILTSNVTLHLFNTSTATPTPKLPESAPLLLLLTNKYSRCGFFFIIESNVSEHIKQNRMLQGNFEPCILNPKVCVC